MTLRDIFSLIDYFLRNDPALNRMIENSITTTIMVCRGAVVGPQNNLELFGCREQE